MPAGLVSGGDFLVRPRARSPELSPLLPEVISSVSDCICDVGPMVGWAWRPEGAQDMHEEAERWLDDSGAGRAALPRLRAWMDAAYATGELGFTNVFSSPEVVRRLVAELGIDPALHEVLGIATTPENAAAFAETEEALGDAGGVLALLARGEDPAPGGVPLGYEVLGLPHSWICNDLVDEAAERFGIRPNAEGLIATAAEAERIAVWADEPETGADPVGWWPWLVTRYPPA